MHFGAWNACSKFDLEKLKYTQKNINVNNIKIFLKKTPKRTNNELPDKYRETSHTDHANTSTYITNIGHHAEKLTLKRKCSDNYNNNNCRI